MKKLVDGRLTDMDAAEVVAVQAEWDANAGPTGRRARVRAERNRRLVQHVDTIGAMRWEAMSDTAKAEWRTYRRALLDVPQQAGFPDAVVWPVPPAEAA